MKAKQVYETLGFEQGGDPYKKMGVGKYADPLKYIEQYIQNLFNDKTLTFEESRDWIHSHELYFGDKHETMLFYNPIEYKEDNIKSGWAIEEPYSGSMSFKLNDIEDLKRAIKEIYDNKYY